MPAFQACLAEVNGNFHKSRIDKLTRRADEFARPGARLKAEHVLEPSSEYAKPLDKWLDQLPPAHQEMLRAVVHHAVTSDPPRHVTFAWATAYDYEVTVWDMPCGITVLLKSRYPGDNDINRTD
jgi:hypothetical protein